MTTERSGLTETLAVPIYRAVWQVLTGVFKVPTEPPQLPCDPGVVAEAFQPSRNFLRYLKFWFWMLMWIPDVLILFLWIVVLTISVPLGVVLTVPALILAIVPDIFVYVALHLRYDTTWYAMSNRSLRIRRGIWVINEVTITFENIQNVTVSQGPLQRFFGIADVVVQTAGGGSSMPQAGGSASHVALIEGMADAAGIRDRILQRVRKSTGAGLGDERHLDRPQLPQLPQLHGAGPDRPVGTQPVCPVCSWSQAHVLALREVRDGVRALR